MSLSTLTSATPDAANRVAAPAVHELTADAVPQWDAFVEACPQATFFHLAGWQQVIEEAFGHRTHYLFAESGGRITGVLPLGHIKSRLFGNALISTPFCVYGGDCRRGRGGCGGTGGGGLRAGGTAQGRLPGNAQPGGPAPGLADQAAVCHLPQDDWTRTRRRICWQYRASSAPWCARVSRPACRARYDTSIDRFLHGLLTKCAQPGDTGIFPWHISVCCSRSSGTAATC